MYRIFSIIFVTCIAASSIYLFFFMPYSVKNDEKSIENTLEDRMNSIETIKKDLSVKKIVKINDSNTIAVFYEVSKEKYSREEKLSGIAILKKGIIGKFKIVSSNYGPKNIFYEIIDTNKGKYVVFSGSNVDLLQKNFEVKFKTIKEDINFDISKDEYYIVFKKVNDEFKEKQFPEINFN